MKSFPVIATIVGTLLALAAGTPVQHHHHRHAASTKALETRDPNAAVTAPYGSTYYNPNFNAGGPGYGASHNMYTCYAGTWKNFPPPAQWISFSSLWQFQVNNALKPIGDNSSEIQAIYDGIVQVSQVSKIDARVILAVIIQESTGNVHVGCTNNGVENCGLMQSHDPPVKAYDPNNYQASITQMIRDGTQGTTTGPGLVQYMNSAPGTGVKTAGILWYALRAYNSGAVNMNDCSDGMGATPSYVSDIANYLQGWQGYGSPNRDTCVW